MSDHSRAVAWLLGVLDAVGSGPTGARQRQCPAHPDTAPSLSIGQGDDGRALIHCHAGCTWTAVLTSLALTPAYLHTPPPVAPADYARTFLTPPPAFPPLAPRPGRSPQARGFQLDAIHDYGPDHRVLRHRHGEKKQMHWETRRGRVWLPGLFGVPTTALPLYREPDIVMAVAANEPVLIVESESSVDALKGWYSTTWAGGAACPNLTRLAAVLADHHPVVIVPDFDDAGLACLTALRGALPAAAVLLGQPGEDARDLLTRVGPDRFRTLVEHAVTTAATPERTTG